MPLKAIIFDMDGVISDTQVTHADVESRVLAEIGIQIAPEEITRRFAGVTNREWFETLVQEHHKAANVNQLIARKWEIIFDPFTPPIKPIPGIHALLERLVALHLKLAVASSSNKAFIEHVLKQLNMTEYFQAIASSEEVPRGKPDPAIFLLAASRLGIDPSECVVIEDGVSGMIGAKRAGMGCIGLVLEAETDTQKFPADVVVRSHDEITKQLLTQFGAI